MALLLYRHSTPNNKTNQISMMSMMMKLLVLMLAGTASVVEGLARCDTSANEREHITKSAVEKLEATGDFDVIEVRRQGRRKGGGIYPLGGRGVVVRSFVGGPWIPMAWRCLRHCLAVLSYKVSVGGKRDGGSWLGLWLSDSEARGHLPSSRIRARSTRACMEAAKRRHNHALYQQIP